MAYGQTGSGKTHTIFGPPNILDKAGKGLFGTDIIEEYGLFPRGMITIFNILKENRLKYPKEKMILTAAAV